MLHLSIFDQTYVVSVIFIFTLSVKPFLMNDIKNYTLHMQITDKQAKNISFSIHKDRDNDNFESSFINF